MQLSFKDTVYATKVEPEVGAERLQGLLKEYTDLASWEKRKACLKEGLMTALELNPPPVKTPLNLVYGKKNEFERYSVQGLAFECVPGGGTQTFLATAVDDRIAYPAPVVQVSCFFPGGCPCESGRPLHIQCGTLSNNAEIAALAAPRPQLVGSDGKDWTHTVDSVEYPYLQKVYGFYEKSDLVENAHFADEGHDYGPSKRNAAYKFFAKQMGLDIQTFLKEDGTIDESSLKMLPADDLAVFPSKQLPDGACHCMEDIYKAVCVH